MNETHQAKSRDAASRAAPLAMVYVKDAETDAILRQCLSDLAPDTVVFSTGGIETAISELTHRSSPRLLVVDVSGAEDPARRVMDLAGVCEPDTAVIVIGESNDIALYRGLKAAGIVEYFYKPLVDNLVRNACTMALTGVADQRTANTGKLVFVIGVKGGVGATSIAIGVAAYLADVRHRRVLLLDLDLTAGDAALQLNLAPNHALWEALEQPARVDNLFLERGLIHVTPKLDLLASLEPFGEIEPGREDAIPLLLTKLVARYRYVFVDLPVSLAPQLLSALRLPSLFLLVSDESLVSARDVVRWRGKIGADTAERQTLHVVNKAGAHGSLPREAFVHALGHTPDVTIPYKREIGEASTLGAQGLAKDGAMAHALAPLLKHIAGEAPEQSPSFISKLLRSN